MNVRTKPVVWKLIPAYGLALLTILPLIFQWPVPKSRVAYTEKITFAIFLLVLGILYWIYRVELPKLGRSRTLTVLALSLAFSGITNQIHKINVDNARNYSPTDYNYSLQLSLHEGVMKLNPGFLPHVYRFLPNAVVRWMELGGVNFFTARDFYRFVIGILIFYALYRYARLFTSFVGAIIAMALTAVISPVSFEHYIGQLTDPLSHLSFLLGLIFLETDNFPYFFTTLLIGSLAKESVLCLVGYYLLFKTGEKRYLLKSGLLLFMTVGVYGGVRLLVEHGNFQFSQVSGVNSHFFITNFLFYDWVEIVEMMILCFIPMIVIGWKTVPLSLKRQFIYLFTVLWLSSLFFSWLHEGRNYMPAVFVLSVAVAHTVLALDRSPKLN